MAKLSNAQGRNWKFIYCEHHDHTSGSCEHCGHEIADQYIIENRETGARMAVGSDCVRQFLADDESTLPAFETTLKRLNRAKAQWRKQNPAPRDGETRDQYIVRRVREMENALKAFHQWASLCQRYDGFRRQRIFNRYVRLNGWLERRDFNQESICYCMMAQDVLRREVMNLAAKHIERTFGANRFDFTQTLWKVRSI